MGTHELLKNLVGVTVSEDIYAGPKVSGAFTFAGLETDFSNAYDYFKDAKVDLSLLSIDNEFSIKTKGFWGRERERKLTKSFSASTFQMKTFPAISDMKTEISGMKMNTVSASFSTSGDVFLPQRIGFALYAKDKPDDPQDKNYTKIAKSVYRPETYFLNSFNGVDLTIDDVAPGVYMARPVIKMTGKDEPIAVYSQEQLITIAPKDLIITPETIQAEEDGGDFSIELFGSLEAPLSCETQDSWIHPEIVPHSSGSMSDIMTVKVDANDTDRFRTGKVTVRMRLSTLETVEKELTVKQYGGLELSPTNLEFETDGGTLDVDFYFTAGSVADYAIGTEKALIRGNGLDFSICIPESDGAFIISGQKSGNSITGLHFATTATDQTNQYFIMKDADGSSSTATWAPMPDDD